MSHRVIDSLEENPGTVFDLLRELVGGHGYEEQALVRIRDTSGENLPTIIFGVEPYDYEEDE